MCKQEKPETPSPGSGSDSLCKGDENGRLSCMEGIPVWQSAVGGLSRHSSPVGPLERYRSQATVESLVESLGPSASPITNVAVQKIRSVVRLPLDIQNKARELMQELQALRSQSGPSGGSSIELCMHTACGVLEHLCLASELEQQATACLYQSRLNEGLDRATNSEGRALSPAFTDGSAGLAMIPAEEFSQLRTATKDFDCTDSMKVQVEEESDELVQQAWTADIGSRRGSFVLTPQRDAVNDGEEMVTSNNKCYLHPESPVRLGWDFTSMMLILALTVLIPLEVCFFWDTDPPTVLVIFSGLIDSFFIADIVLNFFTAYHEGHGISGRLVTDFRGIAKHYAKSWLLIDMGASLPYLELMQLFGGTDPSKGGEAMGMLKVLRYAKVARMMKVLRVLKLGGLMQVVEEKMVAAQSMTVAFQLLKMTVVMMVLSHNVACLWYAVATFSEGTEAAEPMTWLQAEGLDRATGWQQYVAAFYFAITTGTTVGYGDIHPNNTLEQAITTFVLVLSVGYIGQFLARVSQMVSSLRSLENQMVQAKRDALLFMKKRSVQKELQFRVLRYIEHVYETDAITALDGKIMSILSESLQNQLALAVTGNVLKQFPLFEASEENFLTAICQVCRTQRAGIGDTIVSEEQAAHEMFWVVRGEAAVLSRNRHVGGLRTGDWFGELALFFPGAMRKATVRCETNCEFLVLHYNDFQKKVELFPNMRRECDKVAAELRRGNPRVLKIACANCGSMDHFTRDCPKMAPLER